MNTSVTCEIADDGTITLDTCEADSWRNSGQLLAMMVVRATPASAFPSFSTIDRTSLGLAPRGERPLWSKLVNYSAYRVLDGPPPFYRLARLAVSIAPIPVPKVNLTSGALVESAEIVLESGKAAASIDYPPKEVREKRRVTQTVECQVQADRSVICHKLIFDPPENAPYFEDQAKRMYMHAIVKERLKSGNPAAGVRFRIRTRWVLPSSG